MVSYSSVDFYHPCACPLLQVIDLHNHSGDVSLIILFYICRYLWQLLTSKKSGTKVDLATFDSYAASVSDFVKFEIKKDVDRAFGVSDKRMCQRR